LPVWEHGARARTRINLICAHPRQSPDPQVLRTAHLHCAGYSLGTRQRIANAGALYGLRHRARILCDQFSTGQFQALSRPTPGRVHTYSAEQLPRAADIQPHALRTDRTHASTCLSAQRGARVPFYTRTHAPRGAWNADARGLRVQISPTRAGSRLRARHARVIGLARV